MLSYEARTLRNIGILSHEQQGRLREATVALAGVGGVGGVIAERLARLGIGTLRMADPDCFDASNCNRQFASAASTLGRNKAEVLADILRDISPTLCVEALSEGITADNAMDFVRGADIVVEEIEYCYLDAAVALHRAARAHGLFSLTTLAVCFGASMVVYDPDGISCDDYLGLNPLATPEEIRALPIPLEKFVPRLPDYMPPAVIAAIQCGEAPYLPTTSVGCAVAGALAVAEVAAILTGLRPPRVAPQVVQVDMLG